VDYHAPVTRSESPLSIRAGARLLIAGASDQEPFVRALAGTEITPVFARSPEQVIGAVDAVQVDAVFIVGEARASHEAALAELRTRHPDVPIVTEESGEPQAIVHAVRTALLLSYENEQPAPVAPTARTASGGLAEKLLGRSPAMQRVRDLILRAANGMATVLVRGETGTGKELVAQALHESSDRAAGPFVAVHCAALPDSLLESELFGYEKGAFTGAVGRKIGRVEAASGGTLFLDEIGEISPATQAKLLRLLQQREYQRLGGVATLHADVRFVAATHRDLEAMVKEGRFREDLFYRLNVVPLWVPPLRARANDLQLLAQEFCARFARENRREGVQLSEAALQRIRKMRFPGNVRQLQNFVERLVVLGQSSTISEADILASLEDVSPFETLQSEPSSISAEVKAEHVLPLDESMRNAEKAAIRRALVAAGHNRSKAARLLGISRATLYNKLREHDLP
jgi:DNA-binding NtrC family response regulator